MKNIILGIAIITSSWMGLSIGKLENTSLNDHIRIIKISEFEDKGTVPLAEKLAPENIYVTVKFNLYPVSGLSNHIFFDDKLNIKNRIENNIYDELEAIKGIISERNGDKFKRIIKYKNSIHVVLTVEVAGMNGLNVNWRLTSSTYGLVDIKGQILECIISQCSTYESGKYREVGKIAGQFLKDKILYFYN